MSALWASRKPRHGTHAELRPCPEKPPAEATEAAAGHVILATKTKRTKAVAKQIALCAAGDPGEAGCVPLPFLQGLAWLRPLAALDLIHTYHAQCGFPRRCTFESRHSLILTVHSASPGLISPRGTAGFMAVVTDSQLKVPGSVTMNAKVMPSQLPWGSCSPTLHGGCLRRKADAGSRDSGLKDLTNPSGAWHLQSHGPQADKRQQLELQSRAVSLQE